MKAVFKTLAIEYPFRLNEKLNELAKEGWEPILMNGDYIILRKYED